MDDIIKRELRDLCEEHIRDCFKTFGIEGTEDLINTAYKTQDNIREYMLEVYKEIVNRNGK